MTESTVGGLDQGRLFRSIIAHSPDLVTLLDRSGRVMYASPSHGPRLGYDAEALPGADAFLMVHPDDLPRALETFDSLVASSGATAEMSYRFRRAKSGWVHLHSVAQNLLDDPDVRAIVVISRDDTERHRLEARREAERRELLQVQERFYLLGEATHDLIYDWDMLSKTVYWNEAIHTVFGYSAADIGPTIDWWESLIHPDDRTSVLGGLARAIVGTDTSWSEEYRFRHADGSYATVIDRGLFMRDDAGRATRMIGSVIDITKRKAAELALRRSEERFQLVARLSRSVIYDWDATTNRVERSDGLYSAFGYAESSPEPGWWEERNHPEDAARVRSEIMAAMAGTADRWHMTYRMRRADGSYAAVEDLAALLRDESGRAMRVVGVATDVSREAELAEQLRHAQQMEAIGRLAGGIAHDFNNMLTVIVAYADMLRERVGTGDAAADLEEIRTAADRAVRLTRQLLAFSRKPPLSAGTIDAVPLVRDIEKTLARTVGDKIRIVSRFEVDDALVIADPGQLQQVLVNLAMNATDAMPKGGTIDLCVRRTSIESNRRHAVLAPGQYLLIEVRDTGAGMDRATLRRIFDPFFTTKPAGKGSGLGLPTAYAIVSGAGGHIDAHSAIGSGSLFSVYWPLATTTERRVATTPRRAAVRPVSGRVLVVDDEPAVRTLATRVLREAGYEVNHAANGREALEYLEAHESPSLVLTDFVMPEMSGAELAEQVRERWPEVAVMFMSGFADDQRPDRAAPHPGTMMLEKPFGPRVLLQAVSLALKTRAR